MTEVIYCQKCHNKKRVMSYEKAKEALEKRYPDYEIVDRCISTCGLGKTSFFLEVDDEIVMKPTFEGLLEEE